MRSGARCTGPTIGMSTSKLSTNKIGARTDGPDGENQKSDERNVKPMPSEWLVMVSFGHFPMSSSRIHAGPASQNAQEMQRSLLAGLCDPPGFNRPMGNAPKSSRCNLIAIRNESCFPSRYTDR